MVRSNKDKNLAIRLRIMGYSYNYISDKTKISKSTLSGWLKKVNFSPNSITLSNKAYANSCIVEYKRREKIESQKKSEMFADNFVENLSDRDIFMVGFGIYIGEGSKSNGIVRVSNSDPKIIKFAILWLNKLFGIEKQNLKVRLHIYPNIDPVNAVEYWSNEIGLVSDNFYKCSIDTRKDKKKNVIKSGYGTAHLTVISKDKKDFGILLHRKIIATMDRILNAGLV